MKAFKPIIIHRFIVGIIYFFSVITTAYIFYNSKPMNQIEKILSLGAIFASFGSSIIAFSCLFIEDKYKRVRENIDILFKDIQKQEPWRRWPFLKRRYSITLLNSDVLEYELSNPEVPFEVGTHQIKLIVPTVFEDFFDLPVFQHYFRAKRFYKSFLTKNTRDDNKDNKEEKSKQFMTFLCLYDILKSSVVFRLSRYLIHIGIGLIFSSVLFVILYISYL